MVPDPELAFKARLDDVLDDSIHVDVRVQPDRPQVVVDLLSGGTTTDRPGCHRVRLELVCYGGPALTARQVAHLVFAALVTRPTGSWTAAGQAVASCICDPPYPLPDPITSEDRWYVSALALIYPAS